MSLALYCKKMGMTSSARETMALTPDSAGSADSAGTWFPADVGSPRFRRVTNRDCVLGEGLWEVVHEALRRREHFLC